MSLLRFLGLGSQAAGRDAEPRALVELADRLDAMPPEDARLAAAFAYLLARVAGADLRIDPSERDVIADRLAEHGGVDPDQARILADSAIGAAETLGASDDHLVARAFRDMTDRDERLRLLRCLFAVAAADDTISNREDNEIFEIARSIGVRRTDVVALRSEWKAHLGTMKTLPRER